MNSQVNKIFALVTLMLFAAIQQMVADSSAPKPPGLYGGYSMTLLLDGKWLVAGGYKGNGSNADCDKARLYDPATGIWTNTGSMTSKRNYHATTQLSDGKVLVVGGESGGDNSQLSSAEIYDPVAGTWTKTGSMNVARKGGHTATLLSNGKVLVTGGTTNNSPACAVSSAELYDPVTEKWTVTTSMNEVRYGHAAVLLTNGLVLVAGGENPSANYIFSAELYDPYRSTWTMTGSMPYESRYNYTGTLLTNGQILLTASGANYAWELTNAWAVSKELYNPAIGQFTAIGPRKPHFVSSTTLDRTLTISPETGSSFLASEEIEFMVQSADRFGVTNIQFFRDNIEIGEGEESPFRYTVTNMTAGTYTLFAKAAYANGLASTSSPISITFKSSEPQVSLAPGPTEFISEIHVKTSPAFLLANVVGVNPDALTKLTLNGVAQPLQTGNFILHPPLTEGKNVFVLVATDKQGRTGKATTDVYLDSTVPTVSIKEPTNGSSIDAMWVDMHGTFTAKNLKQITIGSASANMEMPASINGNTFEAHNIFLGQGTNIITATAEDMAGNTSANSIVIMGPTDTNAAQTFPVQIRTSISGGFVPLSVTFTVQAHVPGKIQKVIYDFDGDNNPDQTGSDLQPVTHIYKTSGEYFPIITIQTTVGQFSSLSGMFGMLAAAYGNSNAVATVNVQMLPVLMSAMKTTDPVDIKWTATSNLYVLSGSTATITEFDAKGTTIRSLSGIGSNPSGMDVDDTGNVYVAMTASNQVSKFKPTANSFEADIGFSNNVAVENKDGSTDKRGRYVADTENNRVQVFAPADRGGELRLSLSGELGLNHPKSVAAVDDFLEEKLYIADTGNNRVILVKLPSDNPEAVWKHMTARLKAGDVQGAMSDFSIASKDKYQQAYQTLSKDELLSTVKDMENIKPAAIENDHAQYYFESVVEGHTLTFPVEFDREFGKWKIIEY